MIAVGGELDLASSPELEGELERAFASAPDLLIIDLRQLEFMDSTGLSVIVRANQHAEEHGCRFAVVKGPPQVDRLLTMTGVADRLALIAAPEELLDSDQPR